LLLFHTPTGVNTTMHTILSCLALLCFVATVFSYCSNPLTLTENYWTPDRMASAIPRDAYFAAKAHNQPPQLSFGDKRSALACTGHYRTHKDPETYEYYPYTAVGKVFFSFGSNNYVCSGSIGANNRTVWTAGHCTFDKDQGFATNFMFVPAYWNRTEPHGRFHAHSLCSSDKWGGNNMPYDYAVARFTDRFPAELGSLRLEVNLNPDNVDYVSHGYPAASPFDGQWDNTCTSDVCGRDWWMSDPQPVGISCNSNGGSSGGPWVRNGRSIVGLNSYSYIFETNRMWGPYFDSETQQFYEKFMDI